MDIQNFQQRLKTIRENKKFNNNLHDILTFCNQYLVREGIYINFIGYEEEFNDIVLIVECKKSKCQCSKHIVFCLTHLLDSIKNQCSNSYICNSFSS